MDKINPQLKNYKLATLIEVICFNSILKNLSAMNYGIINLLDKIDLIDRIIWKKNENIIFFKKINKFA